MGRRPARPMCTDGRALSASIPDRPGDVGQTAAVDRGGVIRKC